MTDVVSDIARAAARQLSGEFGPGIRAEVEAELSTHRQAEQPNQFVDPVSVGILIVAAAHFAWTVYNDRKKRTPRPSRESMRRGVRNELGTIRVVTRVQLDRVIDVVVDETLEGAATKGEG